MTWEKEAQDLAQLIHAHPSVGAFQEVKARMADLPELQHLVHEMKDHQQDAVFFKKIAKDRAFEEADQEAARLEDDITRLPIVNEYREKMQDASDLLYYVTKGIEEAVNREITHD